MISRSMALMRMICRANYSAWCVVGKDIRAIQRLPLDERNGNAAGEDRRRIMPCR
jgi:hypothetical protein